MRKVESLGLYLVPEQTQIDKQQNAHAMQVAEKIKVERILALQNHGVRQWNKVKWSCMTPHRLSERVRTREVCFFCIHFERQTGFAAQSLNLSK